MFGSIYLDWNHNPGYIIKKLKHAKINEVELFDIKIYKAHNLEKVLNAKNYNFKIKKLSLEGIEYCLLEDLEIKNTLLNCWKILQLSELKSASNIYKILSTLPSNMTVKLGQISSGNYYGVFM